MPSPIRRRQPAVVDSHNSVSKPSSGNKTGYFYDGLNRLQRETITALDGSGTPYTAADYVYTITRADGLRDSVLEKVYTPTGGSTPFSQVSIGWQYDSLGRLISETRDEGADSIQNGGDYTASYAYDLANNRTKQTHTGPGGPGGGEPDEVITSAYNGDDQQVRQTSSLHGTTANGYDPNGSLTTSTIGGTTTTYTFDVRNKMTGYASAGTTATYVYDDAGQRVQESVNGGPTTYYLTDEDNPTGYAQPIEERSGSPTAAPVKTYLIGDRVYGQVTSGGTTSYLVADGHGSTRLMTSSSGAVTQMLNYDAFGSALNFTASSVGTPFQFGGDAVYDSASGLYLHGDGVRGRIAATGAFIEADDLGNGTNSDPISLHKYLYADAEPTNKYDPSGHFSEVEQLVTSGLDAALNAILIKPLARVGAGALIGGAVGGLSAWYLHVVNTQSFDGAGEAFDRGAFYGMIQGAIVGAASSNPVLLAIVLAGLFGFNVGQAIPVLTSRQTSTDTKAAIVLMLALQGFLSVRPVVRGFQATAPTASPEVPPGAARAARFSQNWMRASLQAALERHAGPARTSWVGKTGKIIFENPATGRQVVLDPDGQYFRIFQPRSIGSDQGNYLDLNGQTPAAARVVKGGAINVVPLQGDAFEQATHFRIEETPDSN